MNLIQRILNFIKRILTPEKGSAAPETETPAPEKRAVPPAVEAVNPEKREITPAPGTAAPEKKAESPAPEVKSPTVREEKPAPEVKKPAAREEKKPPEGEKPEHILIRCAECTADECIAECRNDGLTYIYGDVLIETAKCGGCERFALPIPLCVAECPKASEKTPRPLVSAEEKRKKAAESALQYTY